MSVVLRKPSIAVASWGAVIIGWFAWSGDLGVSAHAAAGTAEVVAVAQSEAPIVVRRDAETRLPRSQRRGLRVTVAPQARQFFFLGRKFTFESKK